ncbi:MAG: chemotaxis protein CheW [Deltaproteobacteria bacterium]|nr:chemotaxis protein CheW [Deltaproteobacteria bacterium]
MDLSRIKIFNVRYEGYADGSVKFFSDLIEELTGHSKEEFSEGKVTWTGIMHPGDLAAAKEAVKAGLKGDKTYERDYRIITKNGEIKWILELSQIICDENGKIKTISGILLDTTYQKKLEEEEARHKRLEGKYLNFLLTNEEFGLRVDKIKEIIQMVEITAIPDSQEYVKGVINLRGKVIPVVDLGLKLGLSNRETNDHRCIIVTEMPGNKGLAGIIADSVLDISFVPGREIDDAVQDHLHADYIFGMAKTDRGVRILLDIDRTLVPEEIIPRGEFSQETRVE